MDQLQHMPIDFDIRLDYLSNEMCQMNTRVDRIARQKSRLGGFALSPSPKPTEASSDGGDDERDDASDPSGNDEMTISQ